MDSVKPIVNKVAQKALVTLDLEDYFPRAEDIDIIDLKDFLYKGLVLREADFRESIKNKNWEVFTDRYVVIFCSTQAIIPMWAYMVISAELSPFSKDIASSSPDHAPEIFLYRNIVKLNTDEFKDKRVVVKGCGDRKVPEAAYVQITAQLSKVARVIMFGEPCSTVPVYKKSVH